jgi:hypothetical protein
MPRWTPDLERLNARTNKAKAEIDKLKKIREKERRIKISKSKQVESVIKENLPPSAINPTQIARRLAKHNLNLPLEDKDIREAIVGSFFDIGGRAYLVQLAAEDRRTYVNLLAKVIEPVIGNSNNNQIPVQVNVIFDDKMPDKEGKDITADIHYDTDARDEE